MFMTVFVLRQSLRPFRPLDLNWFPVKWLNDKKCVRDVAVACLTFPFVVWLHGFSTTLLEGAGLLAYDDTVTTAWEQSMRSNDLVSKFFYVLLASFAAPVWEEAIFRGFLFASLSSFINARAAMLISSTLFAVAHFSLEQFLPSRSSDVSCASSLCAPETSSPPRSCTAPGTCGFSSETSSHLSPSSFQPCSPRVYNDKKINRALPHRSHRLSPLSFAPGLSLAASARRFMETQNAVWVNSLKKFTPASRPRSSRATFGSFFLLPTPHRCRQSRALVARARRSPFARSYTPSRAHAADAREHPPTPSHTRSKTIRAQTPWLTHPT